MSRRKEISKDELSPQFLQTLKEWVTITQKIEIHNQEVKRLKELRDNLEIHLVPYMVENNLEKKALQYQDRKIIVQNEKTYTNLSYKYIKNQLDNFFKERTSSDKSDLIEEIIEFIKSKREIKTNKVINML